MLAVAELTTTAIFVEELRTDTTLLVVALVGLVVTLVAAGRLAGRRHRLATDANGDLTRASIDVAAGFDLSGLRSAP
ncbi:MAG: hypothetical protein GY929_27785, partial [Actinomycetia bacterium]|nr:hypothetical protein [Actinomycetes bacterium]